MNASVLIAVLDKLELTRRCLELLFAERSPRLHEVIVVDNGSTDGTAEYLAELAAAEPLLTVLSPGENTGFVGGNNLAAAQATGDCLVFLNNDTEPQSGWLDALVETVERDPSVGAVGAKLVYPDGKLQEAGGIVFADASGWNYGRGDDPDDPRYRFVREVDYCSGAALLVRADLFRELGCFDERYAPAYYEDTDLCFGVRARGLRVLYQPAAVVVHHEGATAGTDLAGGFKAYQVANKEKFAAKWADTLVDQAQPSAAVVRRASDRASGPRVLVVDPIMPAYDTASGSRRLHELLKLLAADGNAVTFLARNGKDGDRYAPELERLGIEVYAGDPDRLRAIGMESDARHVDLSRLLAETGYELAIVDFWYVAEQYLPLIRRFSPRTRIVADTVDVHFVRARREAELTQDEEQREKLEDERTRELAVYAEADALITVTADDRDAVLAELPDATVYVVPNVHDVTLEGPGYADRDGLLFVGNFGHPPNVDAAEFLCREVLPIVRRSLPDVGVTLVGAKPTAEVEALAGDGVVVTGWVPETAPYVDAHRISVAPLRYGAGMKGKIGEALAAGLPVVTTPIGAEGMVEPGEQPALEIAGDAEGFAAAVVRVYQDPARWQELAERGRAHVERHYSPRAVAKNVRAVVERESAARVEPGLTSIVVLVRDQLELTRACLASIEACTPEPHELILVDNGSERETAAFLEEYVTMHADVRLVVNNGNRGFAGGNNQGLALARGDALLLLNNDTVVTDGWLGRLRRPLDERPEVGIVGPVSNRVSGPQLVEAPGYDSVEELPAFAAAWAEEHAGEWQPLERIVGFCMLVRRAVVDRIGGLDERFGSGNLEDDDFSLRAALEGFGSGVARDSFVHHVGNATFDGSGIDYHQTMLTNWAFFKEKWLLAAETSVADDWSVDPAAVAGVSRFIPLPVLGVDHDRATSGRVWLESHLHHALETAARALATGRLDTLRSAFAEAAAWADQHRRYQARCRLVEMTLALSGTAATSWQPLYVATADELLTVLEETPAEPLLLNYAGVLLYELGEAAAAEQLFRAALRLDAKLEHADDNLRSARTRKKGGRVPLQAAAAGDVRKLAERGKRVAAAAKETAGLRLSLCMIVKDEEEMLPGCLASAQDAVDEIVVVDTGSSDRTVEIAESFGAKVVHFPWNGSFADARNVSIDHATGDWIMYLDADEHLTPESGPILRAQLGKTWREAFYFVETNFTGGEGSGEAVQHLALRLWRNRPEYRFEGRIHEQKTASMPNYLPERFERTEVTILHYGYLKSRIAAREKSARNIELLEAEAAERGLTAFGAFNLGTEHVVAGDDERARDYLEQAWRLLRRDARWKQEAYAPMLVARLGAMRRETGDLDGTRALVAEGLGAWPDFTDLEFKLALCAVDEQDWPTAERHVRRCLELGDAPALYSGTVGIGTYLSLSLLGQLREAQGDLAGAEEWYRRSLAEHPRFVQPMLALANLMFRGGATPAEVEALVPDGSPSALMFAASACYEAGHAAEAADWFRRVLERDPANGAARVGLVEALLSERRYDEVLAAAQAHPDETVKSRLALTELVVHAIRGDGESLRSLLAETPVPDGERAVFAGWAGDAVELLPPDALAPAATLLEVLLKLEEFGAFETLHGLYSRIDVPASTRSELLAAIYFRRGFLDSAADEWIASLQAEPAAGALVGLAHVAVAKGMPEDAVTFCDEALQLEPANEQAASLRDALLAQAA
jgi:GT2 family glycosyltransferase/glycosyltransferase involved in cell wall biosynthesis/tetratricopeptide (TPR) repeat protein